MKHILILVLLLRLSLAESLKGTFDKIIVFSCQSALQQYKFQCHEDLAWECTCGYEPMIGSMAQCVDAYYSSSWGKKGDGLKSLREGCLKYGHVEIDEVELQRIMENSTLFLEKASDGLPKFDPNGVKYAPILPIRSDVLGKVKDYKAFLGNFDISQHYGILINIYWIVILIWFGVWNRLKLNSINNKIIGESVNFIRSHISLNMLFQRHFQPFQLGYGFTSLLPSGPESLVLGVYFALNTIFLIIGYDIYTDNSIFGPNTLAQFVRYISDRSGVLSFAHIPLVIVFAGRNNILINLSKLPYSSFMIFHKWTARVMFIDAFIHSIGYLEIILESKSLDDFKTKRYLQWGTAATLIGGVILVQAIHNLRVYHYECFLLLHIIFGVGFLATCWKHVETFGWYDWILSACVLWASDRIMRIFKLWKFGCPKATLQFISDETFKVCVKRPYNWEPFPGCFVYIHFITWSTFWQSHPFTIVDSILEDEMVTIYIKAKDGLTKKILEKIGTEPYEMRVSLEGPYGNKSPLESYQNAILIAGGNGIPGPYYHAIELARKPLLLKQRIKLIWIIRKIESLQWFEQELMKLSNLNIECDIYITRNFNPELVELIPLTKQFSPFVRFFSGRANTTKVLQDEFLNAQGSIGIVTCGPSIMCDDIRSFVSGNLNSCPYRVDLFEELQVW